MKILLINITIIQKEFLGLNENYGEDSYLIVNMDKEFIIRDEDLITKAGWTPFNGVKVKGVFRKFVFKNKLVFNNGFNSELDKGKM